MTLEFLGPITTVSFSVALADGRGATLEVNPALIEDDPTAAASYIGHHLMTLYRKAQSA